MKNISLTSMEHQVLTALFASSKGNGHDFGLVEECRKAVKEPKQLSGIISSLVKKGIIQVHGEVRTDSGAWTQTTWNLDVKEVQALLSNTADGKAAATKENTMKKNSAKSASKTSTSKSTKAVSAKKATKKVAAKKVARVRIPKVAVIVRVAKENPRQPKTHGWKSFNKITKGMSVAEFVKAGGRMVDLRWDLAKGNLKIQ